MAAAAILDFQNFALADENSNVCCSRVYAVQISVKKLNNAEVINILVNPRWRPATSWIFKFRISDEIFKFLLCQGICSSNFIKKAQIHAEVITFGKIQMAAGAILDFQNFHIL